jgi:hypothetical protein
MPHGNLTVPHTVRYLAALGRRFPGDAERIADKLVQAIRDPAFDTSDDTISMRTDHDYAFDGLWRLVAGGPLGSS